MDKEMKDDEYHIIEDFIDPEYAKHLTDYFLENQIQDPDREFYGYLSFGGNTEFFEEEDFRLEFDPLDKIKEMNSFAYNFFVEKYGINGQFALNRSHANLMRTNAVLDAHRDDRTRFQSTEDLANKTYVASFFLNDDYEGGATVFGSTVIKPKAGSLILFPGYHTWHEVRKVISGTRVNILSNFFEIIDQDRMESKYV